MTKSKTLFLLGVLVAVFFLYVFVGLLLFQNKTYLPLNNPPAIRIVSEATYPVEIAQMGNRLLINDVQIAAYPGRSRRLTVTVTPPNNSLISFSEPKIDEPIADVGFRANLFSADAKFAANDFCSHSPEAAAREDVITVRDDYNNTFLIQLVLDEEFLSEQKLRCDRQSTVHINAVSGVKLGYFELGNSTHVQTPSGPVELLEISPRDKDNTESSRLGILSSDEDRICDSTLIVTPGFASVEGSERINSTLAFCRATNLKAFFQDYVENTCASGRRPQVFGLPMGEYILAQGDVLLPAERQREATAILVNSTSPDLLKVTTQDYPSTSLEGLLVAMGEGMLMSYRNQHGCVIVSDSRGLEEIMIAGQRNTVCPPPKFTCADIVK